jgi:hypothetical protein
MKKLFALVLALVMALSVTAMAETASVDVVDWDGLISNEGMDAFVANGQFYNLDALGLKIWIPNGIQPVESEYTAYLFSDEEGTHGVSVFVEAAPEGLDPTDPDALYAYVVNVVGGEQAAPTVVNGIYCVSYTLGGEDLVQYCMTYGTGDGNLVHFVVDGVDSTSQEDLIALMLMMGSISAN